MKRHYYTRKACIDDGFNPELVDGTIFEGIFDIPCIPINNQKILPTGITPFSQISNNPPENEALAFYDMDTKFAEILIDPNKYLENLQKYSAIITPDCSLYRDMPLIAQIANIYRNRAIGYYYSKLGLNVIPNIRWGDERTYTDCLLPEKVAFTGIVKGCNVAIGNYGCIQSKDNYYHFENGLIALIEEIQPTNILVYGTDKLSIFKTLQNKANFIFYPTWRNRLRGGH